MTPEPGYPEPRYTVRWLLTLPKIEPPIDRDCMAAAMRWPTRLARQLAPRTCSRACCWHHSIDWRQASAAAVAIARQLNREHVTEADELAERAITLTEALELPERERKAVETLLCPEDGITLDRLAGDRWRLSYIEGRKRTHAMLEAGVHRTVVVHWREPRR